MNDHGILHTVEEIIECISHLPLGGVKIVNYGESFVDVEFNWSTYKITDTLLVSAYNPYYGNTEEILLAMCLLTASNCLFKQLK